MSDLVIVRAYEVEIDEEQNEKQIFDTCFCASFNMVHLFMRCVILLIFPSLHLHAYILSISRRRCRLGTASGVVRWLLIEP